MEWLAKYDSTRIWKHKLATLAENTRIGYIRYFRKFIDFVGINPDELREMKYLEDSECKPWERQKVENLVREFLRHEEERGLSCGTRVTEILAISHFFKANGLKLNLDSSDYPRGCGFGSKIPTHEEIRRIVDALEDIRLKAFVLMLKDTGLRSSDVLNLKWNEIKEYSDGFYGFKVITKKKGVPARAFFGHETANVLKLLREKRLKGTDKIPPEPEHELLNHPVFATYINPSKPMERRFIHKKFYKVTKLLGLEDITLHGLRKFWEQNFHTEHPAIKKQFNGRTLSDDERAYYLKTDEELLEIYKSQYPNLEIFTENKAVQELRLELQKAYLTISELKAELEKTRKESITIPELLEAFEGTLPADIYNKLKQKLTQVKS